MKKITKRFNEYIQLYNQGFNFAPSTTQFIDDPLGPSPLETFTAWESHGIKLPCNNTSLLYQALKGKEALNLQITMWSQELVTPLPELLSSFSLPQWAQKALENSIKKSYVDKLIKITEEGNTSCK